MANQGKEDAKNPATVICPPMAPLDVLVEVFKRLSIKDLLSGASQVCYCWESAAAESLFLCSDVLDLTPMDKLFEEADQRQYMRLLLTALDRHHPDHAPWKTIIFPRYVILRDDVLPYIAQRTTTLRSVHLLRANMTPAKVLSEALRHWGKLEDCHVSLHVVAIGGFLADLRLCCRSLISLQLNATISSTGATAIVEDLPRLEVLNISRSRLSVEALQIVLDGCRNLRQLDIRGCVQVDDNDANRFSYEAINLPPEILERASRLPEFLYSGGKTCKCWVSRTYLERRLSIRRKTYHY